MNHQLGTILFATRFGTVKFGVATAITTMKVALKITARQHCHPVDPTNGRAALARPRRLGGFCAFPDASGSCALSPAGKTRGMSCFLGCAPNMLRGLNMFPSMHLHFDQLATLSPGEADDGEENPFWLLWNSHSNTTVAWHYLEGSHTLQTRPTSLLHEATGGGGGGSTALLSPPQSLSLHSCVFLISPQSAMYVGSVF